MYINKNRDTDNFVPIIYYINIFYSSINNIDNPTYGQSSYTHLS